MTYKLVVGIDSDDEPFHIEDRYFGSLNEVLSRLCYPWLDGSSFAIYQKQADSSWLLYYHSV